MSASDPGILTALAPEQRLLLVRQLLADPEADIIAQLERAEREQLLLRLLGLAQGGASSRRTSAGSHDTARRFSQMSGASVHLLHGIDEDNADRPDDGGDDGDDRASEADRARSAGFDMMLGAMTGIDRDVLLRMLLQRKLNEDKGCAAAGTLIGQARGCNSTLGGSVAESEAHTGTEHMEGSGCTAEGGEACS